MARVLVVDDSLAVHELCTAILELHGHQVDAVVNGAAALEAWAEEPPDAVLLDIDLGKEDGLRVLDQLIALDPNVKVAMLTGKREPHVVREALRRGAKDYVVKPFESRRLVASVERLLGKEQG